MSDIIEYNPQILGGKPIVKGTRIPVNLIFELFGLNYSIDEILEEYPTLSREILLKILELGRDAKIYLSNTDIKERFSEEVHWILKFLVDENVPLSIKKVISDLGYGVKTLKDFNKLGITNGEVAKIAINEDAIIITFDSDFLSLKKYLQVKSKIIYINIHPRDPKVAQELVRINIKNCIDKLTKFGKIILTKEELIFKEPLEK